MAAHPIRRLTEAGEEVVVVGLADSEGPQETHRRNQGVRLEGSLTEDRQEDHQEDRQEEVLEEAQQEASGARLQGQATKRRIFGA